MKKRVETTVSALSSFSQFCHFPIARRAAVILVALALGSLVSCSTRIAGEDSAANAHILDAAKAGDLEQVKALLGVNPDLVFCRDVGGQTPLHMAAAYGHKDVVEVLLATKADVNARNTIGWTPLSMAAMYDHKDVVEILVARKADINAKDKGHWTPLQGAAARGNKEVVEFLLANRADVNAKDGAGMTPLDWAAKNGHKDVVELLSQNRPR
jgi:ankyrin repeat protein